jgi:hypothetical protein
MLFEAVRVGCPSAILGTGDFGSPGGLESEAHWINMAKP